MQVVEHTGRELLQARRKALIRQRQYVKVVLAASTAVTASAYLIVLIGASPFGIDPDSWLAKALVWQVIVVGIGALALVLWLMKLSSNFVEWVWHRRHDYFARLVRSTGTGVMLLEPELWLTPGKRTIALQKLIAAGSTRPGTLLRINLAVSHWREITARAGGRHGLQQARWHDRLALAGAWLAAVMLSPWTITVHVIWLISVMIWLGLLPGLQWVLHFLMSQFFHYFFVILNYPSVAVVMLGPLILGPIGAIKLKRLAAEVALIDFLLE